MNTRYEYEELIKQRLKGATWNRLKNSLLGKELISYAGVFAEIVGSQYTTFLNNLAPEIADYRGLSVIGYNQGVAYDILNPSTAQVTLDVERDIKPYGASLVIGSLAYYNLSYLRAKKNSQLTLHQGVKKWSSFSQVGTNNGFGNYHLSGVYWMNNRKYIKLPEDTLYSSVRVYIEDLNGKVTPQLLKKTPGYQSKVSLFRDTDNTLCVLLTTPEEYDSYKDVKCYFLVGATSTPKADENGQVEGEFSDGVSVKKVKAYVNQGSESLEEARLSLLNSLAINSSISTKDQIKTCVNTFPQVDDCEPELLAIGQINVWVKPKYTSSLEDVEDYLRLYGEMAVLWRVREGTPVQVSVQLISMDSSLTLEEKSTLQVEVQDFIATNLKYNTVLSAAWLMQAVPDYISRVSVNLLVNQAIEDTTYLELPSIPVAGTIEIYKEDELVGWDLRGYIRGFVDSIKVTTLQGATLIGDVVVCNTTSKRLIFYEGTVTAVESGMWPLVRGSFFLVGEGFFYEISPSEGKDLIRRYNIDVRFSTQSNSLYKDPEQYVSYQLPSGDSSYIENTTSRLISDKSKVVVYDSYILQVIDSQTEESKLELKVISADGLSLSDVSTDGAFLRGAGRKSLLFFVGEEVLWLSSLNGKLEAYQFNKETKGLSSVSLSEVENLFVGALQVTYKKQGTSSILTILSKDGAKYKTRTAYFSVVGVSSLYLRVSSSVTEHEYEVSSAELLSESLIRVGDKILNLNGQEVISIGSNPLLGKAGLVDYSNRVVNLYTTVYDSSDIKYQTVDLDIKEKSKYPVVEEVLWK